ncbi:MAG TPA: DUF4386 domain-containing protein [Steroidobacteraceae bacterium]
MRHPSAPARGLTSAVASPRLLAQIAGAYYLIIFVAAPSGAATATPLRMLLTMACDAAVALIFYVLFKPVSRKVSLTALVFRLIFVAMMTFASLNYFGALDFLQSAGSADAFNTVYSLALVPFGVHCLLIGYLIYRSEFLTRFLGVLLVVAGLVYVTFVSPSFAHHFYPYILIPGAVGEGVLTLWLLIRGIDSEHWLIAEAANRGEDAQ